MQIESLIERFGDGAVLALAGLLIGLVFGGFAQRSRFCLRAAVVEFSRCCLGPKVAIWLLAFAGAVLGTQLLIGSGLLDVSQARQLASRGSLSGAIIGGLMFGVGMVLARGCASRLLVLSATGNLRALVSGLILTLVAQASLRGVLSPGREWLANLWTIEGGPARNLLSWVGAGTGLGIALGAAWLAYGVYLARRNHVSIWSGTGAVGVGLTIAAGWAATYTISQVSFEPVTVKSISFTGSSADTLMGLINEPTIPLGFDVGLVPGVFAGSLIAALLFGDFKLQGYHGGQSMARYITGASLMGFGSMLAGGCAVGAGVTGGAVFAITAWLALFSMWVGAGVTDWLVDQAEEMAPAVAACEPEDHGPGKIEAIPVGMAAVRGAAGSASTADSEVGSTTVAIDVPESLVPAE
ncbi:MAG: YeeE/YedE family protein [Hyphomicrobiaceae bacterium]